jgi:hypothetical protein
LEAPEVGLLNIRPIARQIHDLFLSAPRGGEEKIRE